MAEKVWNNTFLNSFVLNMGVKLQFGPDTQAQLGGSALKWIMPDFIVCPSSLLRDGVLSDGMAAHRWLTVPMADTALARLNNPIETAGTAVEPANLKLLVWSKTQELNFTHFIYLLIKQASANCFWLSNSSAHGAFRYKDICMFKDYPLKLHADFCFGRNTAEGVFSLCIF